MRSPLGVAFLAAFLLQAPPAFSQDVVIGTWQATSLTINGQAVKTPWEIPGGKQPGAWRVIYAADGHYILLRVPTGRPPEKPEGERTKDDWIAQFQGVGAQYGTYTVAGDKITRRIITAISPQNEGTETVVTFRMNGDTLVTTHPQGREQTVEIRYQRVK